MASNQDDAAAFDQLLKNLTKTPTPQQPPPPPKPPMKPLDPSPLSGTIHSASTPPYSTQSPASTFNLNDALMCFFFLTSLTLILYGLWKFKTRRIRLPFQPGATEQTGISSRFVALLKTTVNWIKRLRIASREWLKQRRVKKRAAAEAKSMAEELEKEKQLQEAHEAWLKTPEGIRSQQLGALKAAVPPVPPERMRATIHVNPVTVRVEFERTYPQKGFETKENTYYSVDMILEFSERDRALILENQLEQVSLEDRPTRLNYEILNRYAADEKYRASLRGRSQLTMIQRAMFDQDRPSFDQLKSERTKITLGDYMLQPYSRLFETLPEAHDYDEKLKTQILPKVRQLLERREVSRSQETIEF